MKIPVIINGANGKMGVIACKTIEEHPDFELVAKLGRKNNLGEEIVKTHAKIVIDLTSADSVYENALTIIKHNSHPVIGTSGLMEDEVRALQQLAKGKKLGGVIAPNFSIGAILMMRFASDASRLLPEVEIIEAHHQQKLDAPSATAIKTAEMIANARANKKSNLSIKEVIPNSRGANYLDINIHSIRLPGFLASQQVIFGNTGETLTITHNSIDRSAFMPGLLLACQSVLTIDTLCYGLENLIY